jgi:DUF1680 family protein
VRALYLCSGATDVALETGEVSLLTTLIRLWENLVEKQIYITGGVVPDMMEKRLASLMNCQMPGRMLRCVLLLQA